MKLFFFFRFRCVYGESHGTVVFLLELAETPDDFEARIKVLVH